VTTVECGARSAGEGSHPASEYGYTHSRSRGRTRANYGSIFFHAGRRYRGVPMSCSGRDIVVVAHLDRPLRRCARARVAEGKCDLDGERSRARRQELVPLSTRVRWRADRFTCREHHRRAFHTCPRVDGRPHADRRRRGDFSDMSGRARGRDGDKMPDCVAWKRDRCLWRVPPSFTAVCITINIRHKCTVT